MKRFARIFLAGLAFGIGAEVPTLVATALESPNAKYRDREEQEDTRPRFANPYGPPTQGSPYADRDKRGAEKNPC